MSVSTTNNPTGHDVTIMKNGPNTFGKTTEGERMRPSSTSDRDVSDPQPRTSPEGKRQEQK